MLKLVTFGLLCAVALVVAAHAYEERRFAKLCAAVITANWLLFAMPWIYNPLSPAHILKVWGLPATHEDMWALADLLSLIVVVWAGRAVWWSPMIWTVYLATLSMHALAWLNGFQYVEYETVLDACLVVQIAVLFVVGGDGIADRLSGLRDRFRVLGGASCQRSSAVSSYEAQ